MEQVKKERRGPRGNIEIRVDECKGCSYCVDVCPQKVLMISTAINRMGYHPSSYVGDGCTGCGICFYACPEPGAIAVYKLAPGAAGASTATAAAAE